MQLDAIRLGVDDLEAAIRDYQILLGVPAEERADAARFRLERGAVELIQDAEQGRALRFLSSAEAAPRIESVHGVTVLVDPVPAIAAAAASHPGAPLPAIDHVVIRTNAPERAIRSWRDERGVRLAFDKEFPKRGLRLLFFRSHGITLEYAAPFPPVETSPEDDAIYGVSYRVPDLATARARLLAAQIDVSEIRRGHREATSVCTVRSGTRGIPTLLLERHEVGSGNE